MFAARDGRLEMVKMLVEKGANVKAAEHDGCTVLIWACFGGHGDVGK